MKHWHIIETFKVGTWHFYSCDQTCMLFTVVTWTCKIFNSCNLTAGNTVKFLLVQITTVKILQIQATVVKIAILGYLEL